jgi:hypothetical protein
MPGAYWWECEKCGQQSDFRTACGSAGMAHFIQDQLKKNWDQPLLVRDCPGCGSHSLRIAYEFPKRQRQLFRVYHIVGIDWDNGAYVPMMWATRESPFDGELIYDFKYIGGRRARGLNRPAVFSRSDLKRIFGLYCEKTGVESFP